MLSIRTSLASLSLLMMMQVAVAYRKCSICRSDNVQPGNTQSFYNIRYVGTVTCPSLWEMGQAGAVPEYLCGPIQSNFYSECKCGQPPDTPAGANNNGPIRIPPGVNLPPAFTINLNLQTPPPTPRPAPRPAPTRRPTRPPTRPPTRRPTTRPPTRPPTRNPTRPPTRPPTRGPTLPPTRPPTPNPTRSPTPNPTRLPTLPPTPNPTRPPTRPPTPQPTGGVFERKKPRASGGQGDRQKLQRKELPSIDKLRNANFGGRQLEREEPEEI